jgi:hypothetical protein
LIPESPEIEYIIIDEEKLSTKREGCMATMLEKDLLEGEESMLDFSMFQTEVMLQLGLKIVEDLVNECTIDCVLIFFK